MDYPLKIYMLFLPLGHPPPPNPFGKYAEKINHKTLEESVGGFKKALSGKGFSVHINFSNKGKVLICGTYLNLQTESLVYLMQMIQKLKPGI